MDVDSGLPERNAEGICQSPSKILKPELYLAVAAVICRQRSVLDPRMVAIWHEPETSPVGRVGSWVVRVPDQIRKCVCYVVTGPDRGHRPLGTAFFVSVPSSIDGGDVYSFVNTVTARHVIAGAVLRGESHVFLKVNSADGATKLVSTDVADWIFHPDESEADDVAVLPYAPIEGADYLSVPVSLFATDTAIEEHRIGVGDEVFLTGLFANHYGRERNLPIVRVGNIAAMPAEPVRTSIGDLQAYLVEARSIGGLSGSPVFVNLALLRLPPMTQLLGVGKEDAEPPPSFLLLGLMHGHFTRSASSVDATDANSFDDETLNTGIAIVAPSQRILEVLMQPALVVRRVAHEMADPRAGPRGDQGPSDTA